MCLFNFSDGSFSQALSLQLFYWESSTLIPLTQMKSVDSVGVAYLAFRDKDYWSVTSHSHPMKAFKWMGWNQFLSIKSLMSYVSTEDLTVKPNQTINIKDEPSKRLILP